MNPSTTHPTALKRILRYLKGTSSLALMYEKGSSSLIGYSDDDWAGDHDDRHSTTENVFLLNAGAVSLLSKKNQ